MVNPLTTCTKEEQGAVIWFLWADDVRCVWKFIKDYQHSMVTVFCHSKMCTNGLTCSKMPEQVSLTKNNKGTHPNRLLKWTLNKSTHALILDKRVTFNEVANQLQISHSFSYEIIHDKVSSRWVPKQLTQQQRCNCLDMCNHLLNRYHEEGNAFLSRSVTGDEM
jgi:hypothetical protein